MALLKAGINAIIKNNADIAYSPQSVSGHIAVDKYHYLLYTDY